MMSPGFRPTGRYLAVLSPDERGVGIGVLDLETGKAVSRISVPGSDIHSLRWVGNERLLFSLVQYGKALLRSYNSGGLFVVSRDGSEQRRLFYTFEEWAKTGARRHVFYTPVRQVPDSGQEVIIEANDVDAHSLDLYRLNVVTGKRQHMTAKRPERTQHWVMDGQLVPRVVTSTVAESLETVTHYRGNANAPWEELWRSHPTRGDTMVALAFDADDERLLVATNQGRDTMAVRYYDPRTRTLGETLLEHPRFDIAVDAEGESTGGVMLSPDESTLLGFRIDAEKPEMAWLDAKHQRLQQMIDGALPGRTNLLQRSYGGRSLVESSSDVQAARWYLLDEATGALRLLFDSRPWMAKRQLSAMQPEWVRARDGLDLLVYRFDPAGRDPGKPLPTVILLHGGPWARVDTWGERGIDVKAAQLLASRGYAVLLPTFRGTTGMGRHMFIASRGQFGLSMQEDVEDVTDWAVAKGLADPQRICLSGASYGGYAALMGAVKTPDKYRCVISGLPVTDIGLLLTSGWSNISKRDEPRRFWVDMVGDPATQAAALRAVSPAYHAARIKAAVMIYASEEDWQAPIEQADNMRKALRAAGKEPRWFSRVNEGHGFAGSDTREALYREMFDFLEQQLLRPPLPTPQPIR